MKRKDFLSNLRNINRFVVNEQTALEKSYHILPPLRGLTEIKPLLDICLEHEAYICGGYARYAISRNPKSIEKARDVDIFLYDDKKYDELKKAISDELLVDEYIDTEFAQSWSVRNLDFPAVDHLGKKRKHIWGVGVIQLIKPSLNNRCTSGSLFDILDGFDLSICQASILSEDKILVSDNFYKDEWKRKMSLINIRNPYSTLNRVIKYGKKEYYIEAQEMEKLFKSYAENIKDNTENKMEFLKTKGDS